MALLLTIKNTFNRDAIGVHHNPEYNTFSASAEVHSYTQLEIL